MSQPLTKHSWVVGKSGEGLSWGYDDIKIVNVKPSSSQEQCQQHSDEVEEASCFFEGCKNACLLSLPFWIAIGIIWIF
ncbi:hypothetical protein [Bacillus mycoides]|uniref:hypothetical protein n=1 Tax=Bacillus mycoides TaxID=1405 RepID=UPI001C009CD5|nr:hypothetical protein [Bacillus mycoides]QWI46888.1 hypothetical protein EXW55_28865 [Bacillus mycoides]